MVCLGKKCKANCSLFLLCWDTIHHLQYGTSPPNPKIHVFTDDNQIKNIKDLSSSPPRSSGSFKTPLRSESVQYQSILQDNWDVFTRFIVATTHYKGPVWQRQLCQQAPLPRCATSKWQPNRGEVNLDCICGPSLRARHINSVSVPLWWIMDKASLKKVYIFQVLSCFF